VIATLAGQTASLFRPSPPDTAILAWSPDGRRLALVIAERLAITDLKSHTGIWLPRPMLVHPLGPVSWATATVLAYPPARLSTENRFKPGPDNDLALFDTQTESYLPPIQNAASYLLSPNQTWAVVGQPLEPDPTLAVISAMGGSVVLTSTSGYKPA
jgi:hypothetical protein